ncbi:MAG: hypothetical protein MK108_16695 [Mariniblastus sp.]|nr:hypothetical protein [Mariniblastus sp.]
MSDTQLADGPAADLALIDPGHVNHQSETSISRMNEMGRRKTDDRRKQQLPVATDRRKVNRRRRIDPTTCERDYSHAEKEFIQAMDDYKNRSGRMFPTCSEILEVLISLGYRQVAGDTTLD